MEKINFKLSGIKEERISPLIFIVSAIFCYLLRLASSRLGYNYDFESWQIVADLMREGKNVYLSTQRYNYSPVWMWILYFLKSISGDHFRICISAFVSSIDVAIAALLYQRGTRVASLLILFSPMCIFISGYHNQFDNLAILLGLIAIRYAETRKSYQATGIEGLSSGELIGFSVLLGISITVKHVFIFFPIWFLYNRGLSLRQKSLLIIIPFAMFACSFIPYLDARKEIIQNVIHYGSFNNAPFYRLFLPYVLFDIRRIHILGGLYKHLFFAIMLLSGYFVRRRPLLEQLAFYCIFMILFSSGICTQYFVIPMLFFAYFKSRFWLVYNIVPMALIPFMLSELQLINTLTKIHIYNEILYTFNFYEINYYIIVCILILAVIDVSRPGLLGKGILNRLKSFYGRITQFYL